MTATPAGAQVPSPAAPGPPMTNQRSGSASPCSSTTPCRPSRRRSMRMATVSPRRLQCRARVPQRDWPDQSPHRVSRHARHRSRKRFGQLDRRQLCLSPEIRLRAVQPRRLDDRWILGPLRHAADAVDRFHRFDLSLPLSGTDVRGPGRHPVLIRRRSSFHYNFKNNYGDVHTGYYNGDNYNQPEANDQKAWMTRVTVRPLPTNTALRGLRVTGFIDADAYVANAERHVDRRRHLRAPVRACGFQLPLDDRSGAGFGARARRTRLFDLGNAKDREGVRVGGPVAVRPPHTGTGRRFD